MVSELKKLVEERRKPVIAHHSTWLGIDPHELNADSSVHAGTMQAAYDRLSDGLGSTMEDSDYESGERLDSYMHSYEVPRGSINPTMHMDPHTSSKNVLRHPNTSRKRMPVAPEFLSPYENASDTRVVPYTNTFEDKGSTSYVIPSKLINEGRVKHLGSQFIASHEITDDNDALDFSSPKTGFDEEGNKLDTFGK